MTGLLIFGSKYVKEVYPNESSHVETLAKCFLHCENENLKPTEVINNILNRNNKTFKRRAFKFVNTKKNIIKENKTKKRSNNLKNTVPSGEPVPQQFEPLTEPADRNPYNEVYETFGGKKRKNRKTKRKLKLKKHKKTRRNKRV